MKCSRKNVINTMGTFVISLDFELAWGAWPGEESGRYYRDSILGARTAIPLMLELFKEYEIHATWAIVGLLFFKDRKELLESLPSIKPDYADKRLSVYNRLDKVGENEQEEPYYYGASLIEKIKATPHQEIGSHTFSHYYCLEEGQDEFAFQQDCEAINNIARQYNVEIQNLVLPRNQYNSKYDKICSDMGIKAYRGNPSHKLYTNDNIFIRILRLLDTYLNLFGHNCYEMPSKSENFPLNIKWSRFLRPYSIKLKNIEPLRLKRIVDDMTYAAKRGLVYHLWWHPYNFGINIEANMSMLRDILSHYKYLNQKYGMVSLNMNEFVKLFESIL